VVILLAEYYFFPDDMNDDIVKVDLLNCNHTITFNSIIVGEIVLNYSKSDVPCVKDNEHLPNADYDIKSFLLYSDDMSSCPTLLFLLLTLSC
jgi:hypothetical protein